MKKNIWIQVNLMTAIDEKTPWIIRKSLPFIVKIENIKQSEDKIKKLMFKYLMQIIDGLDS